MAQNTVYQYGQAGLVNAMSRGDAAAITDEMTMRPFTRNFWISRPMAILMMAPATILGMKRRDVSRALSFWTSWKNKLQNHSMPLRTAQESMTVVQMDAKAGFFQSEFGIRAGLPSFSWRPTQSMNVGTEAREIVRRAIVEGSRMWDRWPVMLLFACQPHTQSWIGDPRRKASQVECLLG